MNKNSKTISDLFQRDGKKYQPRHYYSKHSKTLIVSSLNSDEDEEKEVGEARAPSSEQFILIDQSKPMQGIPEATAISLPDIAKGIAQLENKVEGNKHFNSEGWMPSRMLFFKALAILPVRNKIGTIAYIFYTSLFDWGIRKTSWFITKIPPIPSKNNIGVCASDDEALPMVFYSIIIHKISLLRCNLGSKDPIKFSFDERLIPYNQWHSKKSIDSANSFKEDFLFSYRYNLFFQFSLVFSPSFSGEEQSIFYIEIKDYHHNKINTYLIDDVVKMSCLPQSKEACYFKVQIKEKGRLYNALVLIDFKTQFVYQLYLSPENQTFLLKKIPIFRNRRNENKNEKEDQGYPFHIIEQNHFLIDIVHEIPLVSRGYFSGSADQTFDSGKQFLCVQPYCRYLVTSLKKVDETIQVEQHENSLIRLVVGYMRGCLGWIINSVCEIIVNYQPGNSYVYADLTINPIQHAPRLRSSNANIVIDGDEPQDYESAAEALTLLDDSFGDFDDFDSFKKT